jgi:hypothetical protein
MSELSRSPQNITEECWYYEEPFGIEIICELPERSNRPLHIKIGWRKLAASVKRYQLAKTARTKAKAVRSAKRSAH